MPFQIPLNITPDQWNANDQQTQANKTGVANNALAISSLQAQTYSPIGVPDAQIVRVYVDSATGDNSNAGTSETAPVADWNGVKPFLTATAVEVLLNVKGTLVVDSDISIADRKHVSIRDWDDPNAKIEFGAQSDNAAVNAKVNFTRGGRMTWLDVDYDLNGPQASAHVIFNYDFSKGFHVTSTGGGTGVSKLYGRKNGAYLHTEFISSPITAIAGKVFEDVASGADPNAQYDMSSSLTSA